MKAVSLILILALATSINAQWDMYDCIGAMTQVYQPVLNLQKSFENSDYEKMVEDFDDVVFHGSLALTLCFDVVTPLVDFDKKAVASCAKQVPELKNALALLGDALSKQTDSENFNYGAFLPAGLKLLAIKQHCEEAYQGIFVDWMKQTRVAGESETATLCRRECVKTNTYCLNGCRKLVNEPSCYDQCKEISVFCDEGCSYY